ncbi:MAG: hypothetical protein KDD56_08240 [Bdellovibrionales bacterium]|nr:hypothetical protein [Bdellovibrionales bacterium]
MNQELFFSDDQVFVTKAGLKFPGFSSNSIKSMIESLQEELFITEIQTCEAAAYSFAMVIRFALGLSAEGGSVVAFVDDTLAGKVVLSTLRHLRNSGAVCQLMCLNNPNESSDSFKHLIKPLEVMKIAINQVSDSYTIKQAVAEATNSHNVLYGLFTSTNDKVFNINSELNELSTPIHAVYCPTGINPDTGASIKDPLFASSTLSLGAPLVGLNKGKDYAGRHYLCDISLPREVYSREGFDLSPLFSEQPVFQIFPFEDKEEDAA